MAFASTGTRGEWTIDTVNMTRFARSLKQASPAVAKSFRSELRAAADEVVREARKEIAPFSKKIGATIQRSGSVGTLKVSAGGAKAPNAAPFENDGKEGTFRHPTFGKPPWVEQQANPFLAPAAEKSAIALEARIDEAVDHALTAL